MKMSEDIVVEPGDVVHVADDGDGDVDNSIDDFSTTVDESVNVIVNVEIPDVDESVADESGEHHCVHCEHIAELRAALIVEAEVIDEVIDVIEEVAEEVAEPVEEEGTDVIEAAEEAPTPPPAETEAKKPRRRIGR